MSPSKPNRQHYLNKTMPYIIRDVFLVAALISLNIIIWGHCLFGEPSKGVEVAAVVLLSLLLAWSLVGGTANQNE